MNCEEVQKYLSDFLDKSLDVERGAAIRRSSRHLLTVQRRDGEPSGMSTTRVRPAGS